MTQRRNEAIWDSSSGTFFGENQEYPCSMGVVPFPAWLGQVVHVEYNTEEGVRPFTAVLVTEDFLRRVAGEDKLTRAQRSWGFTPVTVSKRNCFRRKLEDGNSIPSCLILPRNGGSSLVRYPVAQDCTVVIFLYFGPLGTACFRSRTEDSKHPRKVLTKSLIQQISFLSPNRDRRS